MPRDAERAAAPQLHQERLLVAKVFGDGGEEGRLHDPSRHLMPSRLLATVECLSLADCLVEGGGRA